MAALKRAAIRKDHDHDRRRSTRTADGRHQRALHRLRPGRAHADSLGRLGFFAAIMMILLGTFQAIEGLVALFNDTFYVVAPSGLLVTMDYTAWGWVHLILGILVVVAGAGVMAGNAVARAAGIGLAALSAIVNLAFIAAYPMWSIIVITIDVIVIYALAVHGREIRSA